jgi:integrase
MRVLKAVLNDARKRGLIDDNPTDAISWHREQRRQTRIGDLPAWAEAVNALPNPVRRAYFWLVLLTGHRRNEIACLRWEDVELSGDAPTMRINAPKRGPAYVVPLAKTAADVLRTLRPIAEQTRAGTPWCFPSYGRTKHLVEPSEATVPGSVHDLRREFISIGIELGIPLVLVKAAVGHAIGAGDVTLGYAVALDVRPVVERIAGELMRRAGVDPAITAEENRAPAREVGSPRMIVPAGGATAVRG